MSEHETIAGSDQTPADSDQPTAAATPTTMPQGSEDSGSAQSRPSAAGDAPDQAAGAEKSAAQPPPTPVPHAGIRYLVLRIAMLITVGGVLYLVGMRGWALLFAAVLGSGILSFFVFTRQREAAARNLEASVSSRSARRQHQDRRDPEPAP